MLLPTGTAVDYGYDAANRLVNIAGNGFPGTVDYVYDGAGRRTTEDRVTIAVPTVSVGLDAEIVNDSVLLVDGQATGGIASVSVNDQTMVVDAAGQIQGSIVLSSGVKSASSPLKAPRMSSVPHPARSGRPDAYP